NNVGFISLISRSTTSYLYRFLILCLASEKDIALIRFFLSTNLNSEISPLPVIGTFFLNINSNRFINPSHHRQGNKYRQLNNLFLHLTNHHKVRQTQHQIPE